MSKASYFGIILIGCTLFISSCAKKVTYQDISENQGIISFSVQDQQILIEKLTKKLVQDTRLRKAIGHDKPALLVDIVKNETSEHISTENVTDTLKIELGKTSIFRIIGRTQIDTLLEEQKLGEMGLLSEDETTQVGKLIGAKYVMFGRLSSIVNYSSGFSKEKQVYYKLLIIIQDLETGEQVLIDEAEINKVLN